MRKRNRGEKEGRRRGRRIYKWIDPFLWHAYAQVELSFLTLKKASNFLWRNGFTFDLSLLFTSFLERKLHLIVIQKEAFILFFTTDLILKTHHFFHDCLKFIFCMFPSKIYIWTNPNLLRELNLLKYYSVNL